jgi:hypothetical protein
MAFPQTSVSTAPAIGVAGQIATLNSAEMAQVDSCTNAEASASIAQGLAVVQGTGDRDGKIPSAQNGVLIGVAAFGHAFARSYGSVVGQIDENGYTPGTSFPLLKRGVIIVTPTENVNPALPVRVQMIANTGKAAGTFRTTADAAKSVDISAFAKWRSTGTAGNPTELWVDFNNAGLAVADS